MHCSVCDVTFASRYSLERHERSKHPPTTESESEEEKDNTSIQMDEDSGSKMDKQEAQANAWRELLTRAYGADSAADVLNDIDGYFKCFNRVRDKLKNIKNLAGTIEESLIYKAIDKERSLLLDQNYDEDDEADKMAWSNRRFAIRKYFKNILQETS